MLSGLDLLYTNPMKAKPLPHNKNLPAADDNDTDAHIEGSFGSMGMGKPIIGNLPHSNKGVNAPKAEQGKHT